MKPRLFVGGFSKRVYLSTRYKDLGEGRFEAITKTDITRPSGTTDPLPRT